MPLTPEENERVKRSLDLRRELGIRERRIGELDRQAAEDEVRARTPLVVAREAPYFTDADERAYQQMKGEERGRTLGDLPNPEFEARVKAAGDETRMAKIRAIPKDRFEKENSEMFRPIPTDNDLFYREAAQTIEEQNELPIWMKPRRDDRAY